MSRTLVHGGLDLANRRSRPFPATINGWVRLGLILAVVGATTATVSSLHVPVAYEATVKVQPSWRLAGSVVTLDRVDKFAATLDGHLKSTANLSGVVAELKLPYGTATLASNLRVTSDRSNYQQIDVTATDSNPERASQVANAVVAAYILQSHTTAETIWVDSAAVPPQSPVRPRPQLEGFTGGLIGALLALSLFYAVGRFEALLHTEPAPQGIVMSKLGQAARRSPRVWRIGGVAISIGALIAATAVSGALSDPTLTLAAFVPLLLVAVIASPVARLAVLAVGGLLVFQSSQALTAGKVAYFFVVAAIALISSVRVWELKGTLALERLRSLLYASAGLALLLAISFVVSRSHGVGAITWARDVAPYGLVVLVPILAIDVTASRPSRMILELVLIGCGTAAALAYANDWLLQREYGSLPVNLPVLQSFMLPAALVVYATAQVLAGRYAALWAAAAVAVCFLLFVTGSRAALLVLVGPIVVAFFAGQRRPAHVMRRLAIGLAPAAGAGVLTAGFLFVSSAIPAASTPATRAAAPTPSPASLASPIAQGSPVANSTPPPPSPTAAPLETPQPLQTKLIAQRFSRILLIMRDPSFAERLTVDRLAWETFAHHPLFGVGPGYVYQWPTPGGQVKTSPYLDSGLSLLAKFGLAAIPVLVLLVIGLARVVRDKGLAVTQRAALAGYCSIVIAWMAVEAPLEDKGLGIGLAVLLVLVITDADRKHDPREVGSGVDDRERAAEVRSVVPVPS
jgi:capsular polysaccharide biosynthesis protein